MSAGFSTGENVQEETEMRSMSREEIRRVIEGKGEGLRVPILYDFWIGKEVFHGDEAGWRQWLEQYPRDIDSVFFRYAGKYGRACGRSGLLLGGSRQEKGGRKSAGRSMSD